MPIFLKKIEKTWKRMGKHLKVVIRQEKIFQLIKILQLRTKLPTELLLCSRFIMDHCFQNFQRLKKICTKELLHTTLLPNYQVTRPKGFGRFGVPDFATLRREQLLRVEILQQLEAKFLTTMVSCARFVMDHIFR